MSVVIDMEVTVAMLSMSHEEKFDYIAKLCNDGDVVKAKRAQIYFMRHCGYDDDDVEASVMTEKNNEFVAWANLMSEACGTRNQPK